MEFKTGDIVINPAVPEWGPGEVLSVADGKAMVKFARRGIRKMAVTFLALADTGECPEPLSPATPAPPRTSTGKTSSASVSRDPAAASGLVAQALAMMSNTINRGKRPAEDDGLEQAERAADLAADAKKKAEQDRRRHRNTAILRFWRDAEVFLIPEVPRSSRPPVTKARRWETVSASLPVHAPHRAVENILPPEAEHTDLPWFRPLPTGFSAAWHIVYLGVLPRQHLSDLILEKTGSEAERPEEPGGGDGCLAAVVLDATGMPVSESYVPASFVPGLARCLAGRGLDQLPLDMLKMQSEFDRRSDSLGEPLRFPRIYEEIQELFSKMQAEGEEARIVVRSVYFRPDPKGRRIDDVQNDLLNSFYLSDLDRLLSLAKTGFGGVFARYLDGEADENRRDVLAETEDGQAAREEALSLERLPAGRWPFPPDQHLLPAQAAAVTEILRGGLTAVNGPPGTGKTRLLCDVIAELVVRRAARLAKLRHPFEAFASGTGEFCPLRSDIMRGTCIAVTGSNNAAVENITRFLPSEYAVSRANFPDAAYFPEVAAAVNAAFSQPDDESLPARPVWGLLAAVLGSSWNCDQFARAFFWGFRDVEKNISLPGMKQVLDGWRSYESKQRAREEWRKAKQDFLDTTAELEACKKQLARSALPDTSESEKEEADSMLLRFMELMKQSRALQTAGDEENGAARELSTRLEALEALARKVQREAGRRKEYDVSLRRPCRSFWKDPDWQLKSVWNDAPLATLRSRLFLQALRLHEWTIKSCARECTANIGAITRYLRGTPVEDVSPSDIWNSLFFMVPVVSSTLASFGRLFSGMGHASLDWVLLDEAGQATPQSAAGALWRAARAAVIGDPQQIEPVVPQPVSLLATLRANQEKNGMLLERWSPESQSVQTLADRSSILGTWMDREGRRIWTGYPLRAHHRCADPMFSVSNRIAYGGQMVQALKTPPAISSPLGTSRWLHVNGRISDTQLVQEELACLRRCMLLFQKEWPVVETPNGPQESVVFVISPFRKVARHCRSLLKGMGFPDERVRCGTIHTFQGREADIVFLVLGSAPGQAGWGSRRWASRTPNILNVALTRARSVIYVIGNLRDWRRHPFFDILSEELPVQEEDIPGNVLKETY